ncbi:putative gpi inositol-deacylase [Phaeomoniella chlamydospora]|uniref:GPI inositol-deacylase n=1 Tax=Phaeomoniella chlamydospora TaxID=158046 RepID=A0A0G2DZG7_PHACM|nr:putative gpi inositol-deacylase [Phaeomoniella chlamydospora]
MSMMSPTYIKLSGFDTEHTRFATKYSLYLYREEGVDEYNQENIGLRGAPVLFIPGNAGSYKQVRSLSSEASRYFVSTLRHDETAFKAGLRSLDFFTLDFNEDLAAFHGQTMIDQADYVNEAIAYILSLYHDPAKSSRDSNLPDPQSVILIGHSMGGIVARTVLTTTNYQPNSVNTIITMSAPHTRPPVTFDSDIVHLYSQINTFWRDAYSQKWANNNPLWHVTLVSIAGGGLDTVVPSDYASVTSLIPETHGFTVFTSGIPDVWTGMDHLSITWCDQLRKVIVKAIFDVIDVKRATQTKPRAERMDVFKRWFLTGLEEGAPKTLPEREPTTLLTFEDRSKSLLTRQERIAFRNFGNHRSEPKARILRVPAIGTPGRFTLLTDQELGRDGSSEILEILFCSTFPLKAGQTAASFPVHINLAEGSPSSTPLACKRPAGDILHIPSSTTKSHQAFDERPPFSYIQYNVEDLADYQFVAVVDLAKEMQPGFVVAEFADDARSHRTLDIGLWRLLSTGLTLKLPAHRPMVTDIRIPALHSSLLSYSLRLSSQRCGGDGETFKPILRQYLDKPHESKWFVNVAHAGIHLHGIAPFMPPPLKGQSGSTGVGFQLWSDPTCESTVKFHLQVDILGSMGKLVMRYRTVFAAFPILAVALVLRKQFRIYDDTGIFISFSEGLDLCAGHFSFRMMVHSLGTAILLNTK